MDFRHFVDCGTNENPKPQKPNLVILRSIRRNIMWISFVKIRKEISFVKFLVLWIADFLFFLEDTNTRFGIEEEKLKIEQRSFTF